MGLQLSKIRFPFWMPDADPLMYTRWFIDQAKMQEDQPSVFSFPTSLFNLLYSQYNQLSPDLINKPQYEKVLTNIYEICIER